MAAQGATKQGWLHKWTNYLGGYRERYFVLDRGVISYFISKESRICRGSMILRDAIIQTEAGLNFTIMTAAGKKSGPFFQLRAHSEKERLEWVMALELAKQEGQTAAAQSGFALSKVAYSSLRQDFDAQGEESSSEDDESEDGVVYDSSDKQLTAKLQVMQKLLESLHHRSDDVATKLQRIPPAVLASAELTDDASKLRTAASSLVAASAEYLTEAMAQQKRWGAQLRLCEAKRKQLEEQFEALAREHRALERTASLAARKGLSLSAVEEQAAEMDSDGDEFFDAESVTGASPRRGSAVEAGAAASGFGTACAAARAAAVAAATGEGRAAAGAMVSYKRRTAVPFRLTKKINMWAIMKNAIGKARHDADEQAR